MRIKRNLVSILGFQPGKSVSLIRTQSACKMAYEVQDLYAKSIAVEIFDPRSSKRIGHFFQERSVFELHDVILEPKNGLVFTQDGTLLEESTNWPIHQLYNSFPWNPKNRLKDAQIKSAIFLTSSAFGHWLMEDLPLTIFLLNNNRGLPILVASNPPKYVKDFLDLVDREVIYLDGPVRVKSLIMVQKNQDSGWPHPKDLSTLNSFEPLAAGGDDISPFRKIYASRRGSRRSPSNEDKIENLFIENGFEVHNLENFDLKSEIRLMKETRILAGVHGSALVNNIWMPRGGTMLDIVNENYWTEAGHRLAHLKGCKYSYLVYEGEYNANIELEGVSNTLKALMDEF